VADAIAYAYDNDVTVVAATGNDGFTDSISYPAALPTPIAVGAVDFKNAVTFYSNQGDEIDIAAPGGDTSVDLSGDGQPDGVLQETHEGPTWGYMFFQGTSMATPHVAGVAALVWANGVRDPDGIRDVLQSTARDLGAKGRDNTYGYGLVDPVAALGKRSSDGGRGIEITNHRVRDLGNGRATISWTTNVASSTMVRGSNGFKRVDDTPVKNHRVTVEGKDGQKASFDIGSSASGQKAHKTVPVGF
jgi:subtilisin family serine protease